MIFRRLRRLGLSVVPVDWRETVERDLLEELSRRNAHRLFGAVWLVCHALRIGLAFRWRDWRGQGQPPLLQHRSRRALLSGVYDDTRYACRRLRHTPAFTAAAIAILALGIGVNTALFSVMNAVLFKSPHVADLDRLRAVAWRDRGGTSGMDLPDVDRVAAATVDLFSDLAVSARWQGGLSAAGHSEIAAGELVSHNYFTVLGLPPAAGRVVWPADASGSTAVVISDRLARRAFGGREHAVGQSIKLSGLVVTVMGVAPPGFRGMFLPTLLHADVWIPVESVAQLQNRLPGDDLRVRVFARVRPGRDERQVASALDVIGRRLSAEGTSPGQGLVSVPARTALVPDDVSSVGMAVGSAILTLSIVVLLIACANLTNLMLARAAGRTGELAVRRAIGASAARVMRLVLVETLVLAGVAAAAGLAFATAVIGLINAFPMPVIEGWTPSTDLSVDVRVLLFTAGMASLATLAIGLGPAWRATRIDPLSAFHGGAISRSTVGGRSRLRTLLVASQVAGSTMLLLAAGLFVQGAAAYLTHDFGFDVRSSAILRVDARLQNYDESQGRRFFRDLLAAAHALPGVSRAALVDRPILGPENNTAFLETEDRPVSPPDRPQGSFARVSPGFLDAVRLPLLRGRHFTAADDAAGRPVAIVNETAARRLWPGQDPLGKRVRVRSDEPWREVIGIAAATDVRRPRLRLPFVFVPFEQSYAPNMAVIVAGSVPPESFIDPLRAVLRSLNPEMPIVGVSTLEAHVSVQQLPTRVAAVVLTAMGATGGLIALIGLYGVIAYVVSQRTREIGLRLALGAPRSAMAWLALREGVRTLTIGVGAGLVLGWGATAFVRAQVFRLPAGDPLLYLIVPATLVAAGVAACYLPARRAARVDPNVALRDL